MILCGCLRFGPAFSAMVPLRSSGMWMFDPTSLLIVILEEVYTCGERRSKTKVRGSY